jgi:hypothetical protein
MVDQFNASAAQGLMLPTLSARTDVGEVLHDRLHLVVGQGLEPHDHDGDVLRVSVKHALPIVTRSPGIATIKKNYITHNRTGRNNQKKLLI